MQTRVIASRQCRFWLAACGLWCVTALGTAWGERPLSIVPTPPATAVIGRAFHQQLTATGGVGSYSWRVVDGPGGLPPGLQLNPKLGLIFGIASAAGSFSFRMAVTDSGDPADTNIKTFIIDVPDALILDWKQAPRAGKESVTGSVVVSNQTGNAMDLTVVIVAVNEVGKAFALAEQHFPLGPEADSPVISFGTNFVLPFGKYTLHADAVGEVASEGQIYRTRKQTADDFVIRQQ